MDEWQTCGKNGEIQENKVTFVSKTGLVAAYGKKIISTGKCEWRLAYKPKKEYYCKEIGIAACTSSGVNDDCKYNQCVVWYHSAIFARGEDVRVRVPWYETDIITIRLDLDENKVAFYQNTGMILECDIEGSKSYRLCAQLDHLGQSLEIISCKYSDSVIADVASLKDIKSSIFKKLKHLDAFKPKLQKLKVQQLLRLQQNIDNSQNECKEIEQSINELKQRLISLKAATTAAISVDITDYKNWSPQDIAKWIGSLENGRFGGVSDILLNSFVEQGISGANLIAIEKNDLFTMGVKNFKDRADIYNHFQSLKTYENDVEGNQNDTQMIE